MNTVPGRKILQALTDYGGYLVDDTFWNSASVVMDVFVHEELEQHYNITSATDLHVWSSQSTGNSLRFYQDLLTIFQHLSVVINNGPDNIGGGGVPRNVSIAEELCDYSWTSTQKFLPTDLNGAWVSCWNFQTDAVNNPINVPDASTSIFAVESLIMLQTGGSQTVTTSRMGWQIPPGSAVQTLSISFSYMTYNFKNYHAGNKTVNCSVFLEDVADQHVGHLVWSSGLLAANNYPFGKITWTDFSTVNISVFNIAVPASTAGYNIKFQFNNLDTNLWMLLPVNISTTWTTVS
eukprot:TRINITY_DN5152_c0_g2_i1.p1 TRINITY_DN5152_c0_g2~~TRINITY_DN5152_c0_g2_i1.p1  ORF type:complete len:312 (-),score=77.85 TRINITY_DN5152_c0_g2_i1:74-949(-)